MTSFTYRAKLRDGTVVADIIQAEDHTQAVKELQDRGYLPIKVEEKKAAPLLRRRVTVPGSQNIRSSDVTTITRQLSDLLGAGLPLLKVLDSLSRQSGNARIKDILDKVKKDVEGGSTFAEALGEHPRIFSRLYVSMVKAGELSGALERVLERLADFREREQALMGRVRAAMAYPAIMAVVGLGTIIFLVNFVIPRFTVLFEDYGASLPLLTQILLTVSEFATGLGGIITLGVIFLLILLAYRQLQTPAGRLAFDRFKLRVPLFGKLFRNMVIARFTRTLATLVRNGVPILAALKMVGETVGNDCVSRELEKVREGVSGGESLAAELAKSKVFPPVVVDMVAVGEQTGNLEHSLERLAESYERQVENAIRALTSLIEPLMILIMGTIVAFIVMAIVLPVFELSTVVR